LLKYSKKKKKKKEKNKRKRRRRRRRRSSECITFDDSKVFFLELCKERGQNKA
jgi:hypothetical protein